MQEMIIHRSILIFFLKLKIVSFKESKLDHPLVECHYHLEHHQICLRNYQVHVTQGNSYNNQDSPPWDNLSFLVLYYYTHHVWCGNEFERFQCVYESSQGDSKGKEEAASDSSLPIACFEYRQSPVDKMTGGIHKCKTYITHWISHTTVNKNHVSFTIINSPFLNIFPHPPKLNHIHLSFCQVCQSRIEISWNMDFFSKNGSSYFGDWKRNNTNLFVIFGTISIRSFGLNVKALLINLLAR